MAVKYFLSLLLAGFKKWQRNDLNNAHFFRDVLQHLGFWPHAVENGEGAARANVWFARYIFWLYVSITACVCPLNVYMFHGVNFFDFIEAIGMNFVGALAVVHVGCLFYRVARFDNVFSALDVMVDAGNRHFVQPKTVLEENIRLTDLILAYYGMFVCAIFPGAIIGISVFSAYSRNFVIRSWYPYDFYRSPAFELSIAAWMAVAIVGHHLMVANNALLMSLFAEAIKHLQLLNHNLPLIAGPQPHAGQDEPPKQTCRTGLEAPANATLQDKILKYLDREPPSGDLSVCIVGTGVWREGSSSGGSSPGGQGVNRSAGECGMFEGCTFGRRAEERLRSCVEHHQAIISYVDAIHKAFDLIMLLQFCNSVVPAVLCVLFFTYVPVFDERTVVFLMFIVLCLLGQVIFCWLADRIAHESEKVGDAVFGCDWFAQSEGFRRSMRIMISRSNRPLVINIVDFIPLSMHTFCKLMELTYSYYTSLTATMDDRVSVP